MRDQKDELNSFCSRDNTSRTTKKVWFCLHTNFKQKFHCICKVFSICRVNDTTNVSCWKSSARKNRRIISIIDNKFISNESLKCRSCRVLLTIISIAIRFRDSNSMQFNLHVKSIKIVCNFQTSRVENKFLSYDRNCNIQ